MKREQLDAPEGASYRFVSLRLKKRYLYSPKEELKAYYTIARFTIS